MKVKTVAEAWNEVAKIFPTDWVKNERLSQNAGYPIYDSTEEGHGVYWISDMNDRIEVVCGSKSTMIWIEEKEVKKEETFAVELTKKEWDYIRRGLMDLALKYAMEADEHRTNRNYGLAEDTIAKADKLDEIRLNIVDKVYR